MTRPPTTSRQTPYRILALIAAGDATVEGLDAEGLDPVTLRVVGKAGLRRARLDRSLLDRLLADGLVAWETGFADAPSPGGDVLQITDLGRARLRRSTPGGDDFRRQHGDLARRAVVEDGGAVVVDEAESPLAWLARRRDKDGRAYLSPARVAAGERLRADFTIGRMMPTVTSNWSAGRVASGKGGAGGLADLTDRALAARDRVRAALDAAGDDLADVLLDVCCFLKGLETIESDRRWPARSAKVVLDIALGRLADHYGLADEARGADRARRLRAWGTGDHRPTVGRASAEASAAG